MKNLVNQRQAVVAAMMSAMLFLAGCGGDADVPGSSGSSASGGTPQFSRMIGSTALRNAAGSLGSIQTYQSSSASGAVSALRTFKTVHLTNAAGATRTHDSERYSQDFARQDMAGFANLGNTCYANAALKFLLHSVGRECLIAHLDMFWENSKDAQETQAAEDFIHLIMGAHAETGLVSNELDAFLRSLQQLAAFNAKKEDQFGFQIIGRQNDASEFLARVSESFGLSALMGSTVDLDKGYVISGEYWATMVLQTGDGTLQGALNQARNVQGAPDWVVSDIEQLGQLPLRLDHSQQVDTAQFDFDQLVQVVVTDQKSQQKSRLTLQPMQVIAHQGTAQSGHYYTYTKEHDGRWTCHDDVRVTVSPRIACGGKPTLINFSVVLKDALIV